MILGRAVRMLKGRRSRWCSNEISLHATRAKRVSDWTRDIPQHASGHRECMSTRAASGSLVITSNSKVDRVDSVLLFSSLSYGIWARH